MSGENSIVFIKIFLSDIIYIMKTIVLTGGGTAGHALPHLAVYPYIKDCFGKFYYIGSYGGAERAVMEKHFEYYPVRTAKFVRHGNPLKNLMIVPEVMRGTTEAKKILEKLKPDIVFSKGGYVAVPVVFAASRLGIPVVSHESDYTAGLANKITANKCRYVLTSFENAAENINNAVFTGPPIREFEQNRSMARSYFGFKGNKPVLTIIGGSLGSVTINRAITGLLPDLLKKYDVLHICGNDNFKTDDYAGYKKVGFIEDMGKVYSVTDVAVSRAGAGTAFELMSLNIPTLFIPLSKKASRGDQILNARYFLRRGMCNMLYEENMTLRILKDKINKTYDDRNFFINNMKKSAVKNGNRKIADILIKLANG